MKVDFDTLPNTSRVWIYQADRVMTEQEAILLKNECDKFIPEWTSHGNDLRASFMIKENIFLILSVDENLSTASGCSIDKSVHFIKRFHEATTVDLLDRSKLAYIYDGEIEFVPIPEIKMAIKRGDIKEETHIYDNMVGNLKDLQTSWRVEAKNSWLSKYFKSE